MERRPNRQKPLDAAVEATCVGRGRPMRVLDVRRAYRATHESPAVPPDNTYLLDIRDDELRDFN